MKKAKNELVTILDKKGRSTNYKVDPQTQREYLYYKDKDTNIIISEMNHFNIKRIPCKNMKNYEEFLLHLEKIADMLPQDDPALRLFFETKSHKFICFGRVVPGKKCPSYGCIYMTFKNSTFFEFYKDDIEKSLRNICSKTGLYDSLCITYNNGRSIKIIY